MLTPATVVDHCEECATPFRREVRLWMCEGFWSPLVARTMVFRS